MDDGEVIVGLNEDWTFVGAKLMEWIAGFVMFFLSGDLVFGWTYSMPLLLSIWVGTTISLAAARRMYPDEERGLRNQILVYFGFPPPGIPAPAPLQPFWSGAPVRRMKATTDFETLGLAGVFRNQEEVGQG